VNYHTLSDFRSAHAEALDDLLTNSAATLMHEGSVGRQRMGTPEAKEIYKERSSTAECVNAISRNRGLRQFLVRGLRIKEGTGRGLVVCDSPQFNACGCTARSSSVGGRRRLKTRFPSGEYGPSDRKENPKPFSAPAEQCTKQRWMASCGHSTRQQGSHKPMGRNVIPSQALSKRLMRRRRRPRRTASTHSRFTIHRESCRCSRGTTTVTAGICSGSSVLLPLSSLA